MGFDDTFKKQWERNKKLDPLTHKALEVVVKQDSKNVKKMARRDAKMFGGDDTWLGARANDLGDEAQKNEDDPVRGIGRAAATAGVIYGGMALAGAGAGGAGAAGAGAAEGAGAAAGAAGAAEGLGAASAAGGAAGGGISFGGAASGSGIGLGAGGSTVGTGLGAAGGSGLTLGSAGTSTAGAVTAGEAAGLAGGSGLSSAGFASGIGSSIPEGSAISGSYGAGSSNGFDWQRWTRMQQQGMGQQQQQRPLEQDEVHFDAEGRPYIASSKHLKTNGREPSAALIARGAAGADQIDENGVQIAAIKALKKRIDDLQRRINEVKKKRGH